MDFTSAIVKAAVDVAKAVSARVVFVYANVIDDPSTLQTQLKSRTKVVLVCRADQELEASKVAAVEAISVPDFDLTRMGQIKMATLIAFSQRLLKPGDVFVFLTGVSGRTLDTLVTMRVGEEFELFQTVGQPQLTEHIKRPVFEKVLRLALELGHEGREGKPVGALFVIGDNRELQKYCVEGRINPFRGYTEKERNVLDDSMADTVKEIAKLDGAFIIKGNGVIVSGCTILRPAIAGKAMQQGLGARHAAAAAITASTKCIAITLSESTGHVRVWRLGTLITEIEKSSRPLLDASAPSSNE